MQNYQFRKGENVWALNFPDHQFAAAHAKMNRADECKLNEIPYTVICERKPNGIGGTVFHEYQKESYQRVPEGG